MELMDQNQDGIIQYDEFLAVMEDWLQGETENSVGGKRKRTLSDSREEVQKKISKFFLQFSKSNKCDETRHSLAGEWGKLSTIYGGLVDRMQDENLEDKDVKLKLLTNTNFKELATEILNAKNPQDATVSVQKALDIFSILDYYTTPSKRREIGQELLNLFEQFAATTARLIGFLKVENSPMLQLVSLKLLTYLVEGPKISATPLTHAFHPSKMFFKQKVKEEKGLSTIIDQFLTTKYREIYPLIVEEVMGFIGNFSRDNETSRDYLLENGALKPVLEMFAGVFAGNEPKITLIRKTTWAISIFCGVSHSTPPNINLVKDALPVLSDLLLVYNKVYSDEDVLMNLYLCFSYLLPGFSVGDNLILKILDMLTVDSINVIQMTLTLINKLIHLDHGISKAFVNHNLMGMLKVLIMNKNRDVVLSVLGIISTLVGLRGEIGAVIEAELVPAIVGYATNSDYVRWRCVKILKYLTRGLNHHVKYLVQKENIVSCLCHMLTFFESHDDVLKSVYNYVGSSYNFEMIRDALIGLNGIILAGEIECEQNENIKLNPYAEFFNFESCFKIGKLVQKIKESNDISPWKVEKGGISIEDTCKGLLVKICEVSSTFKSSEAQKVSNLIVEILSQLYGKEVFAEFKLQNSNFFKQFKERRSKLAQLLDSKIGYDDSMSFGSDVDIHKREEYIKKTLFEDILNLSKQNDVEISPNDINTLFEWWKTKCDGEARVSKSDFKQGLEEKFGIRDKMALEQYYFQFDPKNVGFVDFREFVVGLAVLNKKKKLDKQKEAEENVLKMFFRIYDLDNNGFITPEELYSLLKNIKDAQGGRYSLDDLKAFTLQKFREIDKDGNGKIDFEEFKEAVVSKKLPVPTELNKH